MSEPAPQEALSSTDTSALESVFAELFVQTLAKSNSTLEETYHPTAGQPSLARVQEANAAHLQTQLGNLFRQMLNPEVDLDILPDHPEILTELRSVLPGMLDLIRSGHAAELSAQVASSAPRVYASGLTGVCRVCNDLRVEGHEAAFPRRRGEGGDDDKRRDFFDDGVGRDPRLAEARARAGEAAETLVLEDIGLAEIREQKDAGCRFCRFTWEVLEHFWGEEKVVALADAAAAATDALGWGRPCVTFMIREGRPMVLGCTGFEAHPDWAAMRVDIEIYDPSGAEAATKDRSREEEGLRFVGPATERATRSDGEQAFGFVRDCYNACAQGHEGCRRPAEERFRPMRLIHVDGDMSMRIVETADWNEDVEWVALSHCWGKVKIMRLEQGNYERLGKGISWHELSVTFQNAATVTNMLGFEYLWIDSLCIIQDKLSDWEENAAVMGQVYSCAAIVISAAVTGSNDDVASSTQGHAFLKERHEQRWKSVGFDFPVASDGETRLVKARRKHWLTAPLEQGGNEPPFTRSWATLIRPGDINRRAWAFQESLLARRIVYFLDGGLVFECKTCSRIEGDMPPYPSTVEGSLGFYDENEKWQMTVKAYSRRKLTFASDRLIALSGVTQAFAGRKQDGKYLAGLWSDNLLHGLTWSPMPGSQQTVTTFDSYVAPSWSWASVNCGVVWTEYPNAEPLASVLRAECVPRTSNSFGAVAHGEIELSGRMLPCRVRYDGEYHASFLEPESDGSDADWSKEVWLRADGLLALQGSRGDGDGANGSNRSCRRAVHGDNKRQEDDDYGYGWYIPLLRTGRWNFEDIGLIVGEVHESNGRKFERLGGMSSVPQSWQSNAREVSSILLV